AWIARVSEEYVRYTARLVFGHVDRGIAVNYPHLPDNMGADVSLDLVPYRGVRPRKGQIHNRVTICVRCSDEPIDDGQPRTLRIVNYQKWKGDPPMCLNGPPDRLVDHGHAERRFVEIRRKFPPAIRAGPGTHRVARPGCDQLEDEQEREHPQ